MYTMSGTRNHFPADFPAQLAAYRYRIFVERLGWPLASRAGMEQDQFDRPDTVYVAAFDSDGDLCGCARLLPTGQPYLLGEVFPHLLDGQPVPGSADIWEVSRFAAASPEVTRKLVAAVIACAQRCGARRLIAISPVGMERLLRRMGVGFARAGRPVTLDGKQVLACWIELDAAARSALQQTRSAA